MGQPASYASVTELAGELVSVEQVQRLCNRYYWAASYCNGKSVLEVACGSGQGIGYLAKISKSIEGGDYSEDLLELAKAHYGNRFNFLHIDAHKLPYPDASMDVIILFEAIYYLHSPSVFIDECRRVLNKGGVLLITTANKDLYDFNPSPFSYSYLGVVELRDLLSRHGFSFVCFGDTPVKNTSFRQRIIRPIKKILVGLGFVPKTMAGKRLLKRYIFGKLVSMPAEIDASTMPRIVPISLPCDRPDYAHKVLYCAATLVTD
jgi:SAM-dependent methyltransferase